MRVTVQSLSSVHKKRLVLYLLFDSYEGPFSCLWISNGKYTRNSRPRVSSPSALCVETILGPRRRQAAPESAPKGSQWIPVLSSVKKPGATRKHWVLPPEFPLAEGSFCENTLSYERGEFLFQELLPFHELQTFHLEANWSWHSPGLNTQAGPGLISLSDSSYPGQQFFQEAPPLEPRVLDVEMENAMLPLK